MFPTPTLRTRHVVSVLALGLAPLTASAQQQASFSAPESLSVETPTGAMPGGATSKGKIVRLFKTAMNARDGRLVVVYGDAASTETVWDAKSHEHEARDIFSRFSDDGGATWSDPVNISNTAGHWSAQSDWDGDGTPETFWGDSEKPNIFNSGDIVVVSWVDAYVPEATATWGDDAESAIQGRVVYADPDVYPNVREVPYKATYMAISYNGGETFEYGSVQPPLQLTYGRRDAKQDVHRGAGKKWAVTWQEDPEGLQAGSADGPGDGASGANVTKGTDIWYSWTDDISVNPLALRTNRVPLTNQSEYDTTETNGFPISPAAGTGGGGGSGSGGTDAGSIQNTGSSRANLQMVKVGTDFVSVVAYEETKGIPLIVEGKVVHYHSFPYDAPPQQGTAEHRYGVDGTPLTSIQLNSRRVRFVAQSPNGVAPAIAIFWKEGLATQGGPSDIMVRTSLSLDEAAVAAAPSRNLSTNTPHATSADLDVDTEFDPIEDANAHRGVIRGNTVLIGWCYTWNGPLARYTDLANYNFWVRRSLDGGATWLDPEPVSNITDTKVTVREPRLVAPAKTGTHDENIILAAWGTESNVYDGIGEAVSLDTYFTRSSDQGATWEKVVPMVARHGSGEFETQIRLNDDGSEVYVVAMSSDAAGTEALYVTGHTVDAPASVGTLYCFGDGTAMPCPCGNESPTDTGAGCANSTGAGGLLVATGSASLAADDLGFEISSLPAGELLLLFRGTDHSALGSWGEQHGDGLLCIGGALQRSTLLMTDANGNASSTFGYAGQFGAFVGASFHVQALYRDSAGPCGAGFNATNAVRLTYGM